MKKNLLQKAIYLSIATLSLLFNHALISAQTIIHRDSVTNFLTDYTGSEKVATVPPAIDFGVVDIGEANTDLNFTHWGNDVLGPDDKYYYAIGDHNSTGLVGTVILKSYDPKTKTDEICIYSPDVVPRLADGKWHGRPVINPSNGDMYLIGFYGGQVVKYNIYSKVVTNYGKVARGKAWEEHIWDYKRNRLYGVNSFGEILVFDTKKNEVIYADLPFPNFHTDHRARMLDAETGIFYATGEGGYFYKYNPETKIFTKLKSKVNLELRASTNKKEADGSFWIFDELGIMYKFFPDEDKLISMGANVESGQYTTFIERSPYGTYLYYISAHRAGHVVQYNTKTGEKKIIAQLTTYYTNNHNYTLYGCFGGALSRDGSSLFLVGSGDYVNNKVRPAIFHVHIPQSEKDLESTLEMTTNNILKTSAYPNPFKRSTTISFHINKPGYASLTIMDLTGKIIHALHTGYLQSGAHQFDWNADETGGLSGGIYFYTLQLNNERLVKKLVVL